KGGCVPAVRAGEWNLGVKSILCDAATPSWINRGRKEDAVAGPDHGFGSQAIRDAQTRGEAFFPQLFGMTASKTGCTSVISSKSQPSGATGGSRIGSQQIEEGQVVELLNGRLEHVPTDSEVQA